MSEIKETIDLDCYDDDGNPRASITLGDIAADDLLEFLAIANATANRVPAEFRDKTTVGLSYKGLSFSYERPLTAEETAKKAAQQAAFEAEGLEEERQEYLRLKAIFEPTDGLSRDPSSETHEVARQAA